MQGDKGCSPLFADSSISYRSLLIPPRLKLEIMEPPVTAGHPPWPSWVHPRDFRGARLSAQLIWDLGGDSRDIPSLDKYCLGFSISSQVAPPPDPYRIP